MATYTNIKGVSVNEMSGLKFHYMNKRQRRLYLGVELEISSGIARNTYDMGNTMETILSNGGLDAESKGDGSLDNGREIVLAPATLDVFNHLKPTFLSAFRYLIENRWIDGNDTSAGGHVHVSRRVFGKDWLTRNENTRRLVKWVYANKTHFEKYAMRRETRWATYQRDVEWSELHPYANNTDLNRLPHNYQTRYSAVNVSNANTIEFRMFNGVKSVDQLYANLELVEMIVMTLTKKSVRVLENYTLPQLIEAYKRTHKNAYNHWASLS